MMRTARVWPSLMAGMGILVFALAAGWSPSFPRDPSWAIVFLTAALVWVGWLQWRTYEATLSTTRHIERAYVAMSHLPPGLLIDHVIITRHPEGDSFRHAAVTIRVQNHGNTPARVTATVVRVFASRADALPLPEHGTSDVAVVDIHLVKGEHFDIFTPVKLANDDMVKVEAGKANLYVIGYVDYIDGFGTRHRSGYGRQFDVASAHRTRPDSFIEGHRPEPNNLTFVGNPGYNYDRERTPGEGRDWNTRF